MSKYEKLLLVVQLWGLFGLGIAYIQDSIWAMGLLLPALIIIGLAFIFIKKRRIL